MQDETIRLLHAYQFVAKHGEVSTAIVMFIHLYSYAAGPTTSNRYQQMPALRYIVLYYYKLALSGTLRS
jgi:hypothetical protein